MNLTTVKIRTLFESFSHVQPIEIPISENENEWKENELLVTKKKEFVGPDESY